MTRLAKIYATILASPRSPIRFGDFERLLAAAGFQLARSRGSHRVYRHPEVDELLVVQPRGKDAKAYQVQQFLDIVEKYELRLEE